VMEPDELPVNPFDLFRSWLSAAEASGTPLPEAMSLASATPDGEPSIRMVLYKGGEGRGFIFYTNYESRKSDEFEVNSNAALLFWWPLMERQIRIEGKVERLDEQESEAYFAGRPRGSQIGAWASPQSRPIASKKELLDLVAGVEARFGDGPVPRPPFWGGYLLRPERIEFWEGRADRLHDRVLFERTGSGPWRKTLLAP
jgi:pyridoxamine 5'-phosphate oxidase